MGARRWLGRAKSADEAASRRARWYDAAVIDAMAEFLAARDDVPPSVKSKLAARAAAKWRGNRTK